MKVFSYKKYTEDCERNDMSIYPWAEKCDMQPSDGHTVTDTDGYQYLSSDKWCIEVDEDGNEIIVEEVIEEEEVEENTEEVKNDEVY